MAQYRVKIDGKTVWKGEGDNWRAIPEKYRSRPEDGAPAHHLYETNGDGEEQLFAVQISLAEEES